jgi:hypothetical protein
VEFSGCDAKDVPDTRRGWVLVYMRCWKRCSFLHHVQVLLQIGVFAYLMK